VLFPTIEFGIFFTVVFLASWSLARRHAVHKGFLVLASLFFYAYWDWRFAFLLVGSAAFNYAMARLIGVAGEGRAR
jgi:alginate O-acetyltransferase complex protein AlgI